MHRYFMVFGLACCFLLPVACGGGGETNLTGGSNSAGSGGSNAGGGNAGGNDAGGGNAGGGNTGGGGAGGGGNTGGGGSGGAPMAVYDPNLDGPYMIAEMDDSAFKVAETGDTVPIHVSYPTNGPTAGPYPVVVVAHGFQLPATQYYGYLKRLASHGYVALTTDYPTSLQGTDNTEATKNILAGLDWVAGKPEVKGDVNLAGMTGHSLGGKLAVYAAKLDARVKATIVLDPVDGATGNPFNPNPMCNLPACVDASAQLPIPKPTAFLGELTDSMSGGFQPACAPAAENYQTFYEKTTAPSLEVTVNGANHMSFLDNVSSCGFVCSACKMASLDNKVVNDLSRAYVVAFYERHLRGNAGYDTYLTGAEAKARYVDKGLVTLKSK